MTYVSGTVLTRKEPFGEPDEGEQDLRPYNEIEVVGPSPVNDALRSSEWSGQLGTNLSVKPTTFGAVIDRPQGELQRDYDVKSIPEPRVIQPPTVQVIQPGPSPEEVFAAASGAPPPAPPRVKPDARSPEDVFAAAGVAEPEDD